MTIILLAVIFGLVLSTHQRNKKMYEDIQRIKERLGIVDRNDFHMTNEEIEDELEAYLNKVNDKMKDMDTDK